MSDMRYMDHLDVVAADAVGLIQEKTGTYGDSWKRRGGPGAWFTTVRPIDRLEGIVSKFKGDIFDAINDDPTGRDGSALACVRDIMNYCILIEAHARAAFNVGPHGPARPAEDLYSMLAEKWGLTRQEAKQKAYTLVLGMEIPERPTLADDGGSRPECANYHKEYNPVSAWTDRRNRDVHFCSASCARRFHGEPEPSPASGSHHGLGDDARLDAMERAGEVTEDARGAGGSAARHPHGPPGERLEAFRRALLAAAEEYGIPVETRTTALGEMLVVEIDLRKIER